ncbi:MAG: S8 family serine peptidase, partial [Pseudomonadota bacterium]
MSPENAPAPGTPLTEGLAPGLPSLAEPDAARAQVSRAETTGLSDAQLVYHMYVVFYGREPDPKGYAYWNDVLQADPAMTSGALAAAFAAAGEFDTLYAGLEDAEIVAALYRNVLQREPDAEGLGFWTGLVTAPENGFDLVDLGEAFALAPETAETYAEDFAAFAEALAPQAEDYTGAGFAIVVIDNGFSLAEDQESIVFSYDFTAENDPEAGVEAPFTHGSSVAETALREAPGADIIHLKVHEDQQSSLSPIDVVEALRWVVENGEAYNVAAVNMSIGLGPVPEETASPLFGDEFAALSEMGIVSVAAAGNDYTDGDAGVNLLAADPNVIAASATDASGAFASFSRRNEEMTDIAALGVDVPVTAVGGAELALSGTSYAAPAVAGIVARLQEASVDLTDERLQDDEIVEILQASGAPILGFE